MNTITKQFRFSAGHRLSDYEGKCRRLHGHEYLCEITVASKELSQTGFVMDFGDLKPLFNQEIDAVLDHRFILNKNDIANVRLAETLGKHALEDSIVWFDTNPTAEYIARWIFNKLADKLPQGVSLKEITVWETPTSFATYGRA